MNPVIRTRVSIITREDAKMVEQVHVIEEKNRNFFEINCNVFFQKHAARTNSLLKRASCLSKEGPSLASARGLEGQF